MAYTEDQKSRHITELQRYLYSISHYNEKIPRIFPDGYMVLKRLRRSKRFSMINNLPVTGEIDSATWDRLVEVYLVIIRTLFFLKYFRPISFLIQEVKVP